MPGITVGVDGSDHSKLALERAIKEAGIHRAPLTVLTVHQAVVGYAGGPVTYPEDPTETEAAREAAQAETDKLLAEYDGPRPESVTIKAVHGFPAEELVNASRDADIVVLGSRGAGGFKPLLMGSVTSQVAHHAHCPILIVPPENRG
ncbi:MAG TPA: universal stress protein [Streptosporangiaceae bacterium]|jgi:nucleotide-binding universal stress UspA family protein|nr:universal stress protein [Streptosporangiaceae bacterium]